MENEMNEAGEQIIFTVSEITDKLKTLLEDSFPFIWITGEITNFSSPMSGHFYFSLKDPSAQISAVMFRGQNRHLKFLPEDGMAVTGLGRISLYKPRGTYQIIFEYLEPRGIGALQVAFEQLKSKLAQEGLFDAERKKPLPFLPRKIALITSPSGAVLHDIMKIAFRRFENLHLLIVPVKVQGSRAENEIASAIELVNKHGADVAVIARGGGSLEDLRAFNSETVARAIAASECPIVSAVGHETDFTIADFVADLRAPTPSAAAEMIIPIKENLTHQIEKLQQMIWRVMKSRLETAVLELRYLSRQLVDPVKKLQDLKLRCDEMTEKMLNSFGNLINQQHEKLSRQHEKLIRTPLIAQLAGYSKQIEYADSTMRLSVERCVEKRALHFNNLYEKLNTLSPLAVLNRGYSITRTVPGKKIVRRNDQVKSRQMLEVILAKGALEVTVNKATEPNDIKTLTSVQED